MASEKITAIIDSVKELSVLELKELIDAYCEEFGVSAVAAAAPAGAGAGAPQPHLRRAKVRRAQGGICHALPDIVRHSARRGFVRDLPDAVINYHFIRFVSCRKEHYHDCYP